MTITLRQRVAKVALTGAIALGCAGAATSAAIVDTITNPSIAQADQWRHNNGGWWLQTNNGYATGWKQINGTWYYFDHNGWMKTGWQWIGGKWYYFNNSGAMQKNWLYNNGKWYCFDLDGAMLTGWCLPENIDWYYFNKDGSMVTGWNKIGAKWYYHDKSGKMLIGWQYINGTWYHLNGNGAMDANKWIGNYYVQSDGSMATNRWVGKYYVGTDGLWDGATTNTDPLHISTDFYELNLPTEWKNKVSYSTSNDRTSVYLKDHEDYSLFWIYVTPAPPNGTSPAHPTIYQAETSPGSYVVLALNNQVFNAYNEYYLGTSDYTNEDLLAEVVQLQTGDAITLEEIKDSQGGYEGLEYPMDYIRATIVPTIVLKY